MAIIRPFSFERKNEANKTNIKEDLKNFTIAINHKIQEQVPN